MRRLRIFTVLSIIIALSIFITKGRRTTVAVHEDIDRSWLVENSHPLTGKKDVRPADQTFLTYPEWFLVFSPAEQAGYFKHHTASTFPYMDHINQFWHSYSIVYGILKNNYKFNTGYHVMIWVIGTSTTAEYGIKAAYETLVGKLTNTADGELLTAEDAFNEKYTSAYVDFIRIHPWYEFDFISQLKSLWKESPLTGPHIVRKWERKYFITNELLAKAAYGWLIGLGTKAAYETAAPTTVCITDKTSTGLYVSSILTDSNYMVILPRYDSFCTQANILASNQISFKEIAGNNTTILISVIVPSGKSVTSEDFKLLFTQPIITRPESKRIAIVTTVPKLSKVLRYLQKEQLQIEHIFDY